VNSTYPLKLIESASKSCISNNATVMGNWMILSSPIKDSSFKTKKKKNTLPPKKKEKERKK
jgi:hypothetical protein